jgi:predicted acetyltransferase
MNFVKTDDTSPIIEFRKALYENFTTAIDSMWEALYIASSESYLIKIENEDIGYCCIDSKRSLTQIYLRNEYDHLMHKVINSLIDSKIIVSAKLSSIEPVSFNACLSNSNSIKKNSFCFQYSNHSQVMTSSLNLQQAVKEDTETIKTFYKTQVGFDDNFGYTENLIQRKELFLLKDKGMLIGTGECRLSDSQPDFADIGVAVNKTYRGKGVATQILQWLAKRAISVNRNPICSTTIDNIASKKAIEKAGFYCSHIIFDIIFVDSKTGEK